MSRSNSARRTWIWRRRIDPAAQDLWEARLKESACAGWTFLERPGFARVVLEAYGTNRSQLAPLVKKYGGRLSSLPMGDWMKAAPAPPLRMGNKLEVVREKPAKRSAIPRLYIPLGMAFGSGDHSTTHMLLGALVKRDWTNAKGKSASVLDLGTGSGILALAARLLGARKIVATDFDPEAVRIARENEALNFPTSLVRWRHADVKKLQPRIQYDLVVANIFSEILCQAAPQIVGSVARGGELWLSGILRTQRDEVIAAYRRQGMTLIRAVSRGKWVFLRLSRKT